MRQNRGHNGYFDSYGFTLGTKNLHAGRWGVKRARHADACADTGGSKARDPERCRDENRLFSVISASRINALFTLIT